MTTHRLPERDPALAAPAQLDKPSLGALMVAHIAVDMQTSSLAVLLPPLLGAFHLSYASAAGLISANNLVIAIAQPLFGLLGDYRQARWLVTAGCALCGLAMTAVLFMPAYALVLAAVILSGLGAAAFHPEALSGVRAVSGRRADTGSSIFFFGGSLGFALGPLAAALLLDQFGTPGAAGMLLPVLVGCLALTLRRQPLSRPAAKSAPAPGGAGQPRRQTVAWLLYLLLFIAVRLTITGGLTTFIPLYFSQAGYTKTEIAQLLTVLAMAGTLGTLFSGPAAERVGRRRLITIVMLAALGALAVFLHTTGLLQLAALAVAGAALAAPWTLSVIMVQDQLPSHVGLAGGLTLGTAYGATGVGVAALGHLADVLGLGAILPTLGWLPVVVLGMGLFLPERQPALAGNPA